MFCQISEEDIQRKVDLAERLIGYSFQDKGLICKALMHPSALDEAPVEESYERLEFLGDSIVGAIVAREIFLRFPHMDEGGMTRIKISLVSGATLSQVSQSLGFADIIMFGGSETGTGKRGLHSALENVYEAIVAALFLDCGLDKAREFVLSTLSPLISEDFAKEPENPKSSLQEILQSRHLCPSYEIVSFDGPPHDRTFTAVALCGEIVLGKGSGRSKKDAEASAAASALRYIQESGLQQVLS